MLGLSPGTSGSVPVGPRKTGTWNLQGEWETGLTSDKALVRAEVSVCATSPLTTPCTRPRPVHDPPTTPTARTPPSQQRTRCYRACGGRTYPLKIENLTLSGKEGFFLNLDLSLHV